jgi:hypothetical protein
MSDRLTLEEQIVLASTAREGGFFVLWRFRRTFHPDRVLALLQRVADADRHLHLREQAWREAAARSAQEMAQRLRKLDEELKAERAALKETQEKLELATTGLRTAESIASTAHASIAPAGPYGDVQHVGTLHPPPPPPRKSRPPTGGTPE